MKIPALILGLVLVPSVFAQSAIFKQTDLGGHVELYSSKNGNTVKLPANALPADGDNVMLRAVFEGEMLEVVRIHTTFDLGNGKAPGPEFASASPALGIRKPQLIADSPWSPLHTNFPEADVDVTMMGGLVSHWKLIFPLQGRTPAPKKVTLQTDPAPVKLPSGPKFHLETVITIPDLAGKTASAASKTLVGTGFKGQVLTALTPNPTPANDGKVFSSSPTAGSTVPQIGATVTLNVYKYAPATMPDVVGKKLADAQSALKAVGFTGTAQLAKLFAKEPSQVGSVAKQLPAAGQKMAGGVLLTVYDRTFVMPNLVTLTPEAANNALVKAGYNASKPVSTGVKHTTDKSKVGHVAAQTPAPGTSVGPDDRIVYFVWGL